jgi:hypothetical protein
MAMKRHDGTGSCSLLVHLVPDPPARRLPHIGSFLNRLATRPAIARALAREGITLFT